MLPHVFHHDIQGRRSSLRRQPGPSGHPPVPRGVSLLFYRSSHQIKRGQSNKEVTDRSSWIRLMASPRRGATDRMRIFEHNRSLPWRAIEFVATT